MSVIISVRNANISDTLREYAETKANTVASDYPKITSINVVLGSQKHRYKAEIIVRGKNLNIETDVESYDLYDSIDAVINKAGTQLRKHFDRVQDHHKASKLSEMEIAEEEKAAKAEELAEE